ncbi:MAG TPA: TIGR02281 family clan AA aspartic protease [Burkholderiales bacterium]|nr:TIGR02281 family clan AA aspartic protease [Burkholderiales bacterium]
MVRIIALLLALYVGPAAAADVALIGLIGDKAAVFALDGGEPKTVKIGQKWSGITLIAVGRGQATVEIDGKQRVLQIGQHYRAVAAASDRQNVTLYADSRGHFIAEGSVNGVPVRFMVDTGATLIALPASDARRLGMDYLKGARGMVQTANGPAPAYRVQLDVVKLGDVQLNSVEAIVIEQGLNVALLGMSFLNRVEMRREGELMMLIRRF